MQRNHRCHRLLRPALASTPTITSILALAALAAPRREQRLDLDLDLRQLAAHAAPAAPATSAAHTARAVHTTHAIRTTRAA